MTKLVVSADQVQGRAQIFKNTFNLATTAVVRLCSAVRLCSMVFSSVYSLAPCYILSLQTLRFDCANIAIESRNKDTHICGRSQVGSYKLIM